MSYHVDGSDKLENVRADVYLMVKGVNYVTDECKCHSFSQGMKACVILDLWI